MASRRRFLQGLAAGGLLISLPRAGIAAAAAKAPAPLAGWLRIARDGAVTIFTNTTEIGQGTGTGIAFFMLMAHRSRNAGFIARTAETVVIADMLFTLARYAEEKG